MIPLDIKGKMVSEPKFTKRSVKFLIDFKRPNQSHGMIIPVTMFLSRYNVEFDESDTYDVKGGFESFKIADGKYAIAYNAHHISISEQ